MSSFTQTAAVFGEGDWARPEMEVSGRRFARLVCQVMVLLPLFSLILLPEYVQGLGDPETKSILYRATAGPLRMVDVLLLGLIAAHGVAWTSSRKLRMKVPRELVAPGLGFLAAIALAMIYGALHGGTNLFFDWRALALGIGLYTVFAMWAQTPEMARSAMVLFAAYMAARICLVYGEFVRGGGDVVVGVRIPVFDGPTLSAIVFTAVVAVLMSDSASDRWRKLMWMGLSAASYMLVLLCFRRTFWAELGIATVLLLLIQKRRRGRKLLLATATLATVAAMLGPTFYQRLQSLDIRTHESEFSQDNADHVGEVLDAWEQVRRHPVMGIGLGRSFQTLRIRDWKEESVMVHNAPLHVWLKYGLLGLACYVWFHFAVFRWLYRRQRKMDFSLGAQVPRRIASGAKAPHLFFARYGAAEAVPFRQNNREELYRTDSQLAEQGQIAKPARTKVRSGETKTITVDAGLKASSAKTPPRSAARESVPFQQDSRAALRVVDAPGLRARQVWLGAALVYLAAQFVVSLGFTPWPYSSVQSATLIAFVLAVAMTGTTS